MTDAMHQVYLVDDDAAVVKALCRLLRSAGYEVCSFSCAEEFMERYNSDAPGCLLLDISMPGINGLELQQWLVQSHSPLPVIFLTGHGDIPASVRAMKNGATDFLTKPVDENDLLKAIQEASQRQRESLAARAEVQAIQTRLHTLTPREREVLEQVVAGKLNKQIAGDLGTVEKTIKVHRGRVMQKMGVESLAELVRLAERAGIGRASRPKESGPAIHFPPV